MSKEIKGVSLSFACEGDWEGMQATEKGKFCSQCSKHVHDFTDKTADDLQLALAEHKGKLCGRFRRSQLSDSFLKYAASAFIATIGAGTSACEPSLDEDTAAEELTEAEFMDMPITGDIVSYVAEPEFQLSPAEPKDGYQALYERLIKEVNVPEGLATEGKVYAKMTIDTTGSVSHVEIMRGFDEKAEKETKKVLLQLKESFKPAKQGGKAVEGHLIIPITFKLAKEE